MRCHALTSNSTQAGFLTSDRASRASTRLQSCCSFCSGENSVSGCLHAPCPLTALLKVKLTAGTPGAQALQELWFRRARLQIGTLRSSV